MVVLHPLLLVSAFVNRRWAIPVIAVGGAWAFSPDDWFWMSLYLSTLTGLPLRAGASRS